MSFNLKLVCLYLVLNLAVNEFYKPALCYNDADKLVSKQRSKVNDGSRRQLHRASPSQNYRSSIQQQQKRLSSGVSESFKGNEHAKDNKATGQTESVLPSQETDGNSQVVYVNLARVVNDGSNKNDSTRVIDFSGQLIKQDGQISCGETNRNGKTNAAESIPNRIVGGNKADPGEFPYQVRLNIRSRRGSSLCGGVIIDQRHILTAAHCMTTW